MAGYVSGWDCDSINPIYLEATGDHLAGGFVVLGAVVLAVRRWPCRWKG